MEFTYNGQIQLIFGPMFSGKSTELIRRIRRYTISKRKCVVIKYNMDNRYTNTKRVCTHDQQMYGAIACGILKDVESICNEFDVIGIDEGQFYPDVVEFCEKMANLGKIVVVAALDGTFQRKPFNDILHLIPLAEDIVKLNAVCVRCHQNAPFSQRIGLETAVEVIGGADKYISVCRSCFYKENSSLRMMCDSPDVTGVHSMFPLESPEAELAKKHINFSTEELFESNF
eukprot:TRINITY_DN12425_c0_g1_i1.p1 TRINITY_DN12425_c0_g1~~TRINITY_DN12425_c0_g1_i1.p1  ORF type:complete len:247 (-),score=49.00 TRINITY_DN12425_c0_g1_i1:55-741(-)